MHCSKSLKTEVRTRVCHDMAMLPLLEQRLLKSLIGTASDQLRVSLSAGPYFNACIPHSFTTFVILIGCAITHIIHYL